MSNFDNHMVPISSEYKDFLDELYNLGNNVDVIPYFGGNTMMDANCNTFCLAQFPMRIGVPLNHPLIIKNELCYEDLNNQEIVTLNSEVNCYYKIFNEDIMTHAPKAKLHFANYLDFKTLNYAASYNRLILVGDYLKAVHPLLKLRTMKWTHLLPYCLYYSKNPSEAVTNFIQSFINTGFSGKPEDAPVIDF